MNPFDDSFQESKVAMNPFDGDNEDGASSNPFTEEESYTADVDELQEDAPAEASWQYLGDLPYRRVPIYSNVRWDAAPTTTTNNENNSNDVHNYGLASFPAAALQMAQLQNKFSDRRILLSKTTVTKCVGCPNGGPVAVITLPLLTANTGFTHTELRILTVSGKSLAKLEFPPPYLDRRYFPTDVLAIGFTSRCVLIVILKDSLCLTFDLRGDPVLQPFHILENRSDLQLAHIYEGGVAVLATNKDAAILELFDNHDDPEYLQTVHSSARRIVPTSSKHVLGVHQDVTPPNYAVVTQLPTATYAATNLCHYCAIAVLPRARTLNRHPEVFLSTSDNSVIVVNAATTDYMDVNCRARISSPIVDMSFAPNGRFLACFTEASMLTVISTSFETKVLDFDTSEGSNSPPLEMKWCGEDSVVLHWKNLGVLMVGPYGDWLRFPYEGTENVFLLPEMDCCRVITDSAVEILQRVPPATALLMRIGSIETTAMLLDASDAYHAGSPTSDEAARAIIKTGMLEEAIETCSDSATKEFDIFTQKRLLRAASYGMHFSYKAVEGEHKVLIGGPVSGSDPETGMLPSRTTVKFVDAARKLRILNALRNPDVGFLLTAAQFDSMTPSGVVARLIAMKRPALATEICKYLGLPKSAQLYARASKAAAFVEAATHLSDSETAEKAISIINGDENEGASPTMNRGGYATVALAANKAGRPGVANLLLMLESSVADKVPALISTGAYADALAVATTAR
jgi:vacuolar protein sorting-associated protein 16